MAWLPTLLGLGPDDLVVFPAMAYPTYLAGAQIAGCSAIACDDLDQLGDARPALIWLNSPSNPTGQILDQDILKQRVTWARERGSLVASDECYGEFGWEAEPMSVLHPAISGGRHNGLLAVHSLSKRSNLAGYRAGFVAGDQDVVADLLLIRKHAGMIVPRPVQEAMIEMLGDHDHVEEQRRQISSAPNRAAPSAGGGGVPYRALRGVYLPVGHPGRGLPDFGGFPGGPGHPGRARSLLRCRREPAHTSRSHCDRRTGC